MADDSSDGGDQGDDGDDYPPLDDTSADDPGDDDGDDDGDDVAPEVAALQDERDQLLAAIEAQGYAVMRKLSDRSLVLQRSQRQGARGARSSSRMGKLRGGDAKPDKKDVSKMSPAERAAEFRRLRGDDEKASA